MTRASSRAASPVRQPEDVEMEESAHDAVTDENVIAKTPAVVAQTSEPEPQGGADTMDET